MLKFKSYASSSKGNLNTITDGKTRKLLNHNISSIDAVLISHSHQDHCKAVLDFAKAGIDCYMLPETKKEINLAGHRFITFKDECFLIGTMKIMPFKLEHDVPCSGFLIQSGHYEKAVYITDTAYCKYEFKNLSVIAIECNYSLGIVNQHVASGSMPLRQKSRLLGSHFGLDNVKDFIKANDMSKVKEIHLLHLSNDNSDAELFEREIKKIAGVPVYVAAE